MRKERSTSDSVGFTGLLSLLFVALKLLGHINWSWWWVLSPLWAPLVIAIVIVLFIAVWKGVNK